MGFKEPRQKADRGRLASPYNWNAFCESRERCELLHLKKNTWPNYWDDSASILENKFYTRLENIKWNYFET